MKRLLFLAAGLIPVLTFAQKVELQVDDSWIEIPVQQTQTEVKPGWKIVDIELKDKLKRYLWGGKALQQTDDNFPVFRVNPGANEKLFDYAIVRLRFRKHYRWLQKPKIMDNANVRVSPEWYEIIPEGEAFIIRPLNSLQKGEYILVNLKQKQVGDLGDYMVYPFQVP